MMLSHSHCVMRGYVGFATALAAAYTAFATLLSQEFGTNVLPGAELSLPFPLCVELSLTQARAATGPHRRSLGFNEDPLNSRKQRGVENSGEGKTYHKTPPQKRFGPPTYDMFSPPRLFTPCHFP